jgi:hypothetical protein
MDDDSLDFKVPKQCDDYDDCSTFVTTSIEGIMKQAITTGRNRIIPLDLRRREMREEYLANHKKWFLQNHENTAREFEESVKILYGKDNKARQLGLLDD